MEQWKDIYGYEDRYRVSNEGNILSKKTGKLLKVQHRGEPHIQLTAHGVSTRFTIDELVMTAFSVLAPKPSALKTSETGLQESRGSGLTDEQALYIKTEIIKGFYSLDDLAAQHDVHISTIKAINNSKIFKHIPWPEAKGRK